MVKKERFSSSDQAKGDKMNNIIRRVSINKVRCAKRMDSEP
jgi:hypothetical protein